MFDGTVWLFNVCIVVLLVAAQDEILEGYIAKSAAIGGRAEIPCNMTPAINHDTVKLVLWYKVGHQEPIYSLDAREGPLSSAIHWASKKAFSGRSHFKFKDKTYVDLAFRYPFNASSIGVLEIDDIKDKDGGVYRCRVDYMKSPSSNFRVNLTVIFPPSKPRILDRRGKDVGEMIGPFEEEQSLTLTCEVYEGRPRPSVMWIKNSEFIDMDYILTREGFLRNILHVDHLKREDYGSNFTCVASNSDTGHTAMTSVRLTMNLAPLTVKLLSTVTPLSAGVKHEFRCHTSGSKPSPFVTWKLNGHWYPESAQRSLSRDVTESVLYHTPSQIDNGAEIMCSVENPNIAGSSIQDHGTITVYFTPSVKLLLTERENPNSIREGSKLKFKCLVKANPPVNNLYWRHNGKEIHGESGRVVIRGNTLNINSVKKEDAGKYLCSAKNIHGVGNSSGMIIIVLYAPKCKDKDNHLKVLWDEKEVRVECYVDAEPPLISIHWAKREDHHFQQISPYHYKQEGGRSILVLATEKLTVETELLCWGRNRLGEQQEPCTASIKPHSAPKPPSSCAVSNETDRRLEITCEYNKDLTYEVQAYDADSGELVATLTDLQEPMFSLTDLPQHKTYLIKVFARNAFGRSDGVQIEHYALAYVTQRESKNVKKQPSLNVNTVVLISCGVSSGFCIAVATSILILRRYRQKSKNGRKRDPPDKYQTPSKSSIDSQSEKDLTVVENPILKQCFNVTASKNAHSIEKKKQEEGVDYIMKHASNPSSTSLSTSAFCGCCSSATSGGAVVCSRCVNKSEGRTYRTDQSESRL